MTYITVSPKTTLLLFVLFAPQPYNDINKICSTKSVRTLQFQEVSYTFSCKACMKTKLNPSFACLKLLLSHVARWCGVLVLGPW